MAKWLAAGVTAANLVGAIVALRMKLAGQDVSLAVWLFTAGTLAGSASAIAFDYMFRAMEGPQFDAGRYWAQVESGGERNARREADLEARFAHHSRRLLLPVVMGVGSVALLAAGLLLLVV